MRVNPERIRRYLKRTLARPAKSMTLTLQEAEENEAWQQNFWRNDNPGPEPPVSAWMSRVRAYCNAKGLRCEVFVQDNFDMTKTISWEAR